MQIGFLLLLLNVAAASILEVPENYSTVQEALDATAQGDTVLVGRGIWVENLVTPDRELTLASNFLFSRDSMDIQQTILDGDSLDSVVRIENTGGACFTLRGFTIRNGLGTDGPLTEGTGGGVHVQPFSCAMLEHLVVEENHAPRGGAAIMAVLWTNDVEQPSCSFKHIRIKGNPHELGESITSQTFIWSHGPVVIEDLLVDGESLSGQGLDIWGTPLSADKVLLRNTSYSRLSLTSSSEASFRNIRMEHCNAVVFGLTAAEDPLHASNVQIRNCMWGDWWSTGVIIDSSPLFLDSLVFENNRIVRGTSNGSLISTMRISSHQAGGLLSNTLIRQNMVGDSIPQEAGEEDGYASWVRLLDLRQINVRDLRVVDNVIHDRWITQSAQRYSRRGVLALYEGGEYSIFEDAKFANNLIVDHTEFSPSDPDGHPANQGRSIRFGLGRYNEQNIPTDTTIIRNVIFQNERSPNHVPEAGGIGHMSVGSVMEVNCSWWHSVLLVENITVKDCDDGGIYMFLQGANTTIRNIEVENVSRRGLFIEDWNAFEGTHEISNVWISGVHEQDMYLPYPYTWSYQQPMSVYGSGDVVQVSNVTIEACSTNVMMLSEATWINCTITDNQFNYFYSPMESCCDESFFMYSNLPVDVPGQHLMLSVDPVFDSELGAPYLDASSPLVDAGNPDARYHDVADPENPGWALWPSQGGLRNDIGYTGGPHAAIPDTSWVDVEPNDPDLNPAGFHLGDPYPNPFNATAQIGFLLDSPTHVLLTVHNMLGQKVETLIDETRPAGRGTFLMDGSPWASCVYFITLAAAGEVRTKKVLLLK